MSLDGSPSLIRVLKEYTPLKNLQTLAADADVTLKHVSCFFILILWKCKVLAYFIDFLVYVEEICFKLANIYHLLVCTLQIL